MLGNGFTRKKVESLTLGEKLRKLRTECGVNLVEMTKHTGIRREYLEFLERGEYTKLPADVYIRGFVRSYAKCLGVDPKGLVRLYERERSIARNLGKESALRQSGPERNLRSFVPFVVTPKVFFGAMLGIVVFGMAAYLYHEFQLFVADPFLVVLEPKNGDTVNGSEISVSGKTDRDARLSLNNEPVIVDESGEFAEKVRLQPGINTLEFRVMNRFDKERRETVSVTASFDVPKPDASDEFQTPGNSSNTRVSHDQTLVLSVVEGRRVSVRVSSDGNDMYKGPISFGEMKEFDCKKSCLVDSTSASDTIVSWAGGMAKPLGEGAGPISAVSFPIRDDVDIETEENEDVP